VTCMLIDFPRPPYRGGEWTAARPCGAVAAGGPAERPRRAAAGTDAEIDCALDFTQTTSACEAAREAAQAKARSASGHAQAAAAAAAGAQALLRLQRAAGPARAEAGAVRKRAQLGALGAAVGGRDTAH
jgi:hypothetical protein